MFDPNANLAEQRQIIANIRGDGSFSNLIRDFYRLAELAAALDNWLSGGGQHPHAWTATQRDRTVSP